VKEEALGSSSSSSGGPLSTPTAYTQEWDLAENALVRYYQDGLRLVAHMEAGPQGFLVAKFGSEAPIETEVPNLTMQGKAPGKVAAGKGVKKRPAAKPTNAAAPEEEEEEKDAPEAPEGPEAPVPKKRKKVPDYWLEVFSKAKLGNSNKHPVRTYVQGFMESSHKWGLVVEVFARETDRYRQFAEQLAQEMVEHQMTKEEVWRRKEVLLENQFHEEDGEEDEVHPEKPEEEEEGQDLD
jgi:hypothetical protein